MEIWWNLFMKPIRVVTTHEQCKLNLCLSSPIRLCSSQLKWNQFSLISLEMHNSVCLVQVNMFRPSGVIRKHLLHFKRKVVPKVWLIELFLKMTSYLLKLTNQQRYIQGVARHNLMWTIKVHAISAKEDFEIEKFRFSDNFT